MHKLRHPPPPPPLVSLLSLLPSPPTFPLSHPTLPLPVPHSVSSRPPSLRNAYRPSAMHTVYANPDPKKSPKTIDHRTRGGENGETPQRVQARRSQSTLTASALPLWGQSTSQHFTALHSYTAVHNATVPTGAPLFFEGSFLTQTPLESANPSLRYIQVILSPKTGLQLYRR